MEADGKKENSGKDGKDGKNGEMAKDKKRPWKEADEYSLFYYSSFSWNVSEEIN